MFFASLLRFEPEKKPSCRTHAVLLLKQRLLSFPSLFRSLLLVQLRDGSVLMGLHRGENSTLSRLEEALVNDGEWHHLQLDISSLGRPLSHHKAVLSLDQGLYLVGLGLP